MKTKLPIILVVLSLAVASLACQPPRRVTGDGEPTATSTPSPIIQTVEVTRQVFSTVEVTREVEVTRVVEVTVIKRIYIPVTETPTPTPTPTETATPGG